jgi:uncharacterized protein
VTPGGRVVAVTNVTRGTSVASAAVVADSLWGRFRGLMGRSALGSGEGLWLTGTNSIHMSFMRFPIDCVFLSAPSPDPDASRTVVGVRRAVRPWRGVVLPVRDARDTLELPVGTVDASGTEVGDVIRIEPA